MLHLNWGLSWVLSKSLANDIERKFFFLYISLRPNKNVKLKHKISLKKTKKKKLTYVDLIERHNITCKCSATVCTVIII